VIAGISIVLDIVSIDEKKKSHTNIVLLKIIVLSLTTYAGIYYMFPRIYGVDAWWFNRWIDDSINLGQITEGVIVNNGYYQFPAFELLVTQVRLITTLSTYDAIFASTSAFVALSCIFVYAIGSRLVNIKLGLFAALIIPLTDNSIHLASAVIAMSLGFCFYYMIMYLVFRNKRKSPSDTVLIILVSISVIMTHSIAATVTFISLLAIIIGTKFYRRADKSIRSAQLISWTLVLLFGISMVIKWMQPPPNQPAFFHSGLTSLITALRLDRTFTLSTSGPQAGLSLSINLLNQGGYLILMFFSILGAFIFLHDKNRDLNRTALIFITGVIVLITYVSIIFGISTILPGRWNVFLYVSLVILAMHGLLSIAGLVKNHAGRLAVVVLVPAAILFFMVTGPVANTDSPIMYNGSTRLGYTQSEITAIQTLYKMEAGSPKTDIYYAMIFPYVIGNNENLEMAERSDAVFILRNYYLQHPEWNESFVTRIHDGGDHYNYRPENIKITDYIVENNIENGVLIYASNGVKVYTIPETE